MVAYRVSNGKSHHCNGNSVNNVNGAAAVKGKLPPKFKMVNSVFYARLVLSDPVLQSELYHF